MHRRILFTWALCLAGLQAAAAFASAGAPQDPLRFVPAQADFVIKFEQPGRLVENVYDLEPIRQLQKLDLIRKLYDNPNARRFEQVLRYIEKQLGSERYALLDKLTGGGMVIAGKLGDGSPKFLAVIQSKDADVLSSFNALALDLLKQEANRQDKPFTPKTANYRDHPVMSIDDKIILSVIDGALLAASHDRVMKAAIDCFHGEKSVTTVATLAEARKLIEPNPAAWAWLNLEALRQLPEVQKGFEQARKDPNSLLFLGAMTDIAFRSPFAAAGLYQKDNEYLLSFRMPRGREGMQEEATLLMAPAERTSLPLLEPKGVLLSTSYFLDLKLLWENRAKLLKAEQLKQLEDFDNNSGRFLAGAKISTLVQQAGPYQRVVVAQTEPTTYKKKPQFSLPSFAVVVDMRDAAFGKSVETVLRGAAFLGGFQVGLNMVEEDRAGAKLVSFRFDEDKELKGDTTGIRFNFSPCFATVKNQFFIGSSVELGRELIDILDKEDGKKFVNAETVKVYSSGAATLMRAFEDQLLTQAVLSEAFDPKTAREQLREIIQIISDLGVLENSSTTGRNDFRYDFRMTFGNKR